MRLPLPVPPPARAAARALRSGVLALLALALAGGALALDVTLDPPRLTGGFLWATLRLSDLFDDRVEESLTRGMPATLDLHAELWRRRRGWFDRLESSYDASVRIRYEVWNEWFQVERTGAPSRTLGTLDSLRLALSRPLALPVAPAARLQSDGRYYLVVSATLKPLSVEDVEEVEGWLSGEVETKRRAGFGIFTELPRSLFDAVRNFSGFGDHRARAISPEFDLGALERGRR